MLYGKSKTTTKNKEDTMQEILIKKEFQELIHPLSKEEKDTLEKDILDKGCLDSLKTWGGYLIDGHHRYAICQKHSVDFKAEALEFEDEEAVKLWMIDNQMGRRNITDAAKISYALLRSDIEKDRARKRQACGQGGVLLSANLREANDEKGKVSEIIAKEIGIGARTIEKFKTIQEKAPEKVVKALCEGASLDGKKLSIDKVYRDVQQQERREQLKVMDFPQGKYRIIYADPPWQYNDELIENYGGAEKHYATMTIDELCALPIKDLADENAVLFLWVTSPLLEASFRVISAWGFTYKTNFIWDKVKHNMGHYNSMRHEMLLVCTKGSCTPDELKLFDSVQSIERSDRHSEKPEEFRKIIDKLYKYGNKIELFARKETEGWEVYGNELS